MLALLERTGIPHTQVEVKCMGKPLTGSSPLMMYGDIGAIMGCEAVSTTGSGRGGGGGTDDWMMLLSRTCNNQMISKRGW